MEQFIFPKGCVFNSLEDIKDKHITVMGLGLNGGGEACVKFFLKHGAYVIATDMKTQEQLKPTIDSISHDTSLDLSKLTYVLGEHRIEDFKNADCVIKNPGVKIQGNEYLAEAKAIETDISIFLHFTKSPIIAVTGSKGKSSTVSAIDYGLKNAGFTSFLGGNITVSPLTFLDKTNEKTPVVLELSSWQLADLRGRKALKPKIAIITKIVPDHQNWYSSMDSYIEDKKLIYADQDENDFTILDFDDDDYKTECAEPKDDIRCWGDLFAKETKAKVLRYSKKELPPEIDGVYQKNDEGYFKSGSEEIKIMGSLFVPGSHMKTNVLNAAAALYLMNVEESKIPSVLGSWKGVPHRLEFFHKWNTPETEREILFYNDSCATVPEAAVAASQSFGKKVIFITGGTDKSLNFLPLAQTLKGENNTSYVPAEIYLLSGSGTDKLTPLLDQRNVSYNGPFDSLEVLLEVLKKNLTGKNADSLYSTVEEVPSIPVVFSPGATSFGMFTNEFDRGNKFKSFVEKIFC